METKTSFPKAHLFWWPTALMWLTLCYNVLQHQTQLLFLAVVCTTSKSFYECRSSLNKMTRYSNLKLVQEPGHSGVQMWWQKLVHSIVDCVKWLRFRWGRDMVQESGSRKTSNSVLPQTWPSYKHVATMVFKGFLQKRSSIQNTVAQGCMRSDWNFLIMIKRRLLNAFLATVLLYWEWGRNMWAARHHLYWF